VYCITFTKITLYDPHGFNNKVTLLFELRQDRRTNSHFLYLMLLSSLRHTDYSRQRTLRHRKCTEVIQSVAPAEG